MPRRAALKTFGRAILFAVVPASFRPALAQTCNVVCPQGRECCHNDNAPAPPGPATCCPILTKCCLTQNFANYPNGIGCCQNGSEICDPDPVAVNVCKRCTNGACGTKCCDAGQYCASRRD